MSVMTTSIRLHIHTLKRVPEYYILLLPKSQVLFGILSCFDLFSAHYNHFTEELLGLQGVKITNLQKEKNNIIIYLEMEKKS